MSNPSGHRSNLLNLRFVNNNSSNRANSSSGDHDAANNLSTEPLSPSTRVSSPSSSTSSSSPNYTDFIDDHYGQPQQSSSTTTPKRQLTLDTRPGQLNSATYVSAIRPPLSPVHPGNSGCSPSSDRFRSSSTGSIHHHSLVQPASPIGLHKRHSKSINSKSSIQSLSPSSPSQLRSPTIVIDSISSSSNLLSFSKESSNLKPSSQAMSDSQPSQDSSSNIPNHPLHPSNERHHLQPSPNSLALPAQPERLGRNQKTKSYQHNDDLAFYTSPTISQALASTLKPASVIAAAAASESRHTHDKRTSNFGSPDSSFKLSSSPDHSISPKPRGKSSLVKRSTLRNATNVLRNASRRVVNLSGAEQIDELPRPPHPQRRRPRSNTIESNGSIELDYAGQSRPAGSQPAQARFSDSEETKTHSQMPIGILIQGSR
ncbi:hypothetical protein H4Q26_009732 [Puccinia striiformis f. sp. tritici PST-130]|nr:hypothetical protein H4Q26_009732 [Puccinia striiformis f. sp. tritici PST-130]